jgi:hypothetical protein
METREEDDAFYVFSFKNGVRSSEKMKIPMNLHLPPPSTTVLRLYFQFPARPLNLERRQSV